MTMSSLAQAFGVAPGPAETGGSAAPLPTRGPDGAVGAIRVPGDSLPTRPPAATSSRQPVSPATRLQTLPTAAEMTLTPKAEIFAPFVKRVAARVFAKLDEELKWTIQGDVGTGRATANAEVVMDRHGHFVSCKVVEQSGVETIGLGAMILAAATPETFFDEDPPSGAEADDGKIHFVLVVEVIVAPVADPRPGVSYRGVAGVGLK
jgi:hypothetical protein